MNEIDDNLRKDLVGSRNISQTNSPIKSPFKTFASRLSTFNDGLNGISRILKISQVQDIECLYKDVSAFGKIAFFDTHYINKT